MLNKTKIISVGTATPEKCYTQEALVEKFSIKERRIAQLFMSTRIKKRHLFLPDQTELTDEPQSILIKRHEQGALEIGESAIKKALQEAGLGISDIDYLCITTSTGFLLPGLSAHLIKKMNFRQDIQRLDIVGMGCNAGLNGLNAVNNWALANPNKNAILLCVEICSALYVNNGTLRAHVVNSLFGDGAAAVVLRNSAQSNENRSTPSISGFSSYIIPDAIDSMKIDWDDSAKKFNFYLHHTNPYVVGRHIDKPVTALLQYYQLDIKDIDHWVVHGGGRNVISAVRINLGISSHDMRHTLSVLMDYGNVSSASFLFSYERLMNEKIVKKGDRGIMITIGPGAQLESALIEW